MLELIIWVAKFQAKGKLEVKKGLVMFKVLMIEF